MHSGLNRQEASGSPIRSRTGSEKVTAEDLWDAEYKMPVGDFLEDVAAQPLPAFYHQFLMAGWAEVTPLTGEGLRS